jgi:hypothetical protein
MRKIFFYFVNALFSSVVTISAQAMSGQGLNESGVESEKKHEYCVALEYYKKSAELKYGPGASNAARILIRGDCGGQDVNAAMNFLRLAASLNHKQSQKLLAQFYLEGTYVEMDYYYSYYYTRRAHHSKVTNMSNYDNLDGLNNIVEDMIAERQIYKAAVLAEKILNERGYSIPYPAFKHALILYVWDIDCSYFNVLPASHDMYTTSLIYCPTQGLTADVCLGFYKTLSEYYAASATSSVPCVDRYLREMR